MSRIKVAFQVSCFFLLATAAGLAQQAGQNGQAPQAPVAPGYFMSGPATTGAALQGHPLLGGTTVLEGEQISTNPTGTAILARDDGGMVTLGHDSSAKVVNTAASGSTLYLSDGLATVYGVAPVVTPQGQLNPGSADTCYQVVTQGSKTYILGVSGTTQAQGGNATYDVGPDQAYVLQTDPNGAVVASPVAPDTVRTMVQQLQGDTVTKVQTASPIR